MLHSGKKLETILSQWQKYITARIIRSFNKGFMINPNNLEEFFGSFEKRVFLQKLLIGIGMGLICYALILLLVPTHIHF